MILPSEFVFVMTCSGYFRKICGTSVVATKTAPRPEFDRQYSLRHSILGDLLQRIDDGNVG